jgi:hypothetical protein
MPEIAMRYALVTDLAVSWTAYEELAAALLHDLPAGLIVHAAGPTDEGVRIVDVWQSEGHYRVFREQQLQPLLGARAGSPTVSLFRDLRVRHLVAPSIPTKRKASHQ